MAWTIEFGRSAAREFEGLDPSIQTRLRRYIRDRLAVVADPRRFGKPLKGDTAGLGSFRLGDDRMAYLIEDERSNILVPRIAHRREFYR